MIWLQQPGIGAFLCAKCGGDHAIRAPTRVDCTGAGKTHRREAKIARDHRPTSDDNAAVGLPKNVFSHILAANKTTLQNAVRSKRRVQCARARQACNSGIIATAAINQGPIQIINRDIDAKIVRTRLGHIDYLCAGAVKAAIEHACRAQTRDDAIARRRNISARTGHK